MKKHIGILIAISALIVFGAVFARSVLYSPNDEVELKDAQNVSVINSTAPNIVRPEDIPESHHPLRLIIPSLSINAAVQKVGVKTNGDMANPNNFTDVGWFKHGVAPGYVGSSVLAGHVDNGLGKAGVFSELHTLKIGDSVHVEREDGVKQRFVVTDIKSYPYKDAPLRDIFAQSDKARLNLITCVGDWLAEEKTYTERLVVYTELVE